MNVLETMKQALDDLQSVLCNPDGEVVAIPPPDCFIATDAIFAAREAIEQMEKAQPVAWIDWDYGENDEQFPFTTAKGCGIPVYRHPAPAVPSITDAMMDLVDRLGHEADAVDPRAWSHLMVYVPKPAPAAPEAP